LDSVKCITDEYVIGIDKGCTDNTEAEVKRFFEDNNDLTREVYNYDWADSFSAARNEGMDKAKNGWILIIDGHEFFPEDWFNITEGQNIRVQDCLKMVKAQLPALDTDEVFFHLYQQPFNQNIPANYFMQPRIYRNGYSKLENYTDKKIRFNRAAHNVITFSRPDKGIHFPEIIIIHDAPEENRKERQEQRIKMNVAELKKDLKKKKTDTRALFYLGNTLMEAKRYKEAVSKFKEYLKNMKMEHSEVYQCHLHMGLCYKELGMQREQRDSLYKAVSLDCNRRDAFLLLGDLYTVKEDYEKAIFNYTSAMMIKPKHSRMFANGGSYTWLPHQQIAQAYIKSGDKQRAIAHLRSALKYVNNEGWTRQIKELSGEKRNILIVDAYGSFTREFETHLKDRGYDVVKVSQWNNGLAAWADLIWCEWADQNAAQIGQFASKTVIRVHGYEAYVNKPLFNQIPWNCKSVVFVAKHIMEMMKGQIPSLNGQCKFISNGVDIKKYFIKNRERDQKNIGYAGLMNLKKGPMRLAEIIKKNPDMNFHLRVDWQDDFFQESFKYETADCKNIVYHGRYENLNDFWNQMAYVISTSDIESFSFNVGEAMAAGCEPMIYNWKGAKEIWKPGDIFTDAGDVEKMIKISKDKIDMVKNRQYVIDKFPLEKSLNEMERELMK
jgi:tetratricopeptide (TPR) repeat protein